MNELGKILLYFIGTILLGAALAPPLYWAGQAFAGAGGPAILAESDFQKYFNRAMLIAAVALLWPVVRWLDIKSVRDLGIERDARWRSRFAAGFIIAGICVALLAAGYIAGEVYRFKKVLPWGKVPPLLVSALAVAVIEEALFRGGMLGLFRRTMRPAGALIASSGIFAVVHFLKPDDSVKIGEPGWLSGFQLIPDAFHQFAEWPLVLAGFCTLFILGLLLGDVTLRTRSLWMAMGLHAGVVFVKMSFSKLTKREDMHLPWIGNELQIGLVPVLALLLAWALARWWIRFTDAWYAAPAAR